MLITTTIALILSMGIPSSQTALPPAPYGPTPNPKQIEWYRREIIAFFHFGINTFGDEVNEGDGKANPTIFNPTQLDCGQWMKVLRRAGIPAGILVAKHADGFCNWPSAYTDYSVKKSKWKGGKGDVVREYTDACRRAGIKAAIYLGPHDRHEPSYGTPAYADYYANQLSELMTGYGPLWEIWWDGAGADFLTTNFYTRWAAIIHRNQPNCVFFATKNSYAFADCRWVGNESGYAGDPCWSTIDRSSIRDESNHIQDLNHGEVSGNAFVPAEVDVSIRPSWFYHASEDLRVKTVPALIEIYCNSVGRNSVLLLNFPPDRRGLVPDTDAKNAAGLHDWIKNTFSQNLLRGAKVSALHPRGKGFEPSNLLDNDEDSYYASSEGFNKDVLEFEMGSRKTFDCLMAQEYIQLGQRVTLWSVEYSDGKGTWQPVPNATNKESIGHKWIVRFPPITAAKVRLTVSGRAPVALATFGVYKQYKK
jgi:alpha-L-fucosidase